MGKPKIPKSDDGGGGGSDWLTTYADLVTLLMTFFVLLFSMSTINPVKWDALINSYGRNRESANITPRENLVDNMDLVPKDISEFVASLFTAIENVLNRESEDDSEFESSGSPSEIDFSTVYEMIRQYIIANDLENHMGLDRTLNEIIIRFKDRAFFDSGRADLTATSVDLMKYVGDAINLVIEQVEEILIVGHTDNVPQRPTLTSPFRNNRELGQARALAVAQWFEEFSFLPGEKITTSSRSEYDPIATNDTPEGRSENRRVEVIITRVKGEDTIDYMPSGDEDSEWESVFEELGEIEPEEAAEEE